MIAFECGSELIGNAFAESNFVILEAIALLAPNESQQTKRVPGNSHRRYQSRPSPEGDIEHHSYRQWQIRFMQLKGFDLPQNVYQRWIFRDVEGLHVRFDQASNI